MEKVKIAFDLAHLFTRTWWAPKRKQKLKQTALLMSREPLMLKRWSSWEERCRFKHSDRVGQLADQPREQLHRALQAIPCQGPSRTELELLNSVNWKAFIKKPLPRVYTWLQESIRIGEAYRGQQLPEDLVHPSCKERRVENNITGALKKLESTHQEVEP